MWRAGVAEGAGKSDLESIMILRNGNGATCQESERHRVIVWGLQAEKVARLLRKGGDRGWYNTEGVAHGQAAERRL